MASAQTRRRPPMQLYAYPKPHLRLKPSGHLASTHPAYHLTTTTPIERAMLACPKGVMRRGSKCPRLPSRTEPAEVLTVGSVWSYLKVGA